MPLQSKPVDLISKGNEPSTLPHHGGRDPTGHHRNFKLAYHRGHYYRQPGNQKYMLHFYNLEVTIQGLSKLELLISHCNCSRFSSSAHIKANRQTNTLSTQDLDQAQTCCVKMVQQFLIHKKGMDGTKGCCHHFSQDHAFIQHRKVLSQGEDDDNSQYLAMHQMIYHQIIPSQDGLSQQKTQGFIMLGHNQQPH